LQRQKDLKLLFFLKRPYLFLIQTEKQFGQSNNDAIKKSNE